MSFASTALQSLCQANSTAGVGLVSCSLLLGPCAGSSTLPSCQPLFLVRSLCATDAALPEVSSLQVGSKKVCGVLVKEFCDSTPSDPSCAAALPQWPSSASLQTLIAPSCQGFPPPSGCKSCLALSFKNATVAPTTVAALVQCDMLPTYVSLCSELSPSSAQCTAYAPICSTYPSICPTPPANPPPPSSMGSMGSDHSMGGHGGSSEGGGMAMFLHLGISDLVLFETFVPANQWQYFGALVFTFGLVLLEGYLGRVREMAVKGRVAYVERVNAVLTSSPVEKEMTPGAGSTSLTSRATSGNPVNSGLLSEKVLQRHRELYKRTSTRHTSRLLRALFGVSDTSYVCHQIWKLCLKTASAFIGFLVMLIVMQFNVGYIVVACLGYGVSAMLFENVQSEVVDDGCCS
ncbi:Ctr copper transporter family-domain-containing protein [Chytriomyces cf. hyalinus JEL632]|nr:Ctr copper transporter family-domain-containing protein [Chytriomyces cf. hyalinus JEL632]